LRIRRPSRTQWADETKASTITILAMFALTSHWIPERFGRSLLWPVRLSVRYMLIDRKGGDWRVTERPSDLRPARSQADSDVARLRSDDDDGTNADQKGGRTGSSPLPRKWRTAANLFRAPPGARLKCYGSGTQVARNDRPTQSRVVSRAVPTCNPGCSALGPRTSKTQRTSTKWRLACFE